MPKTIKYIGTQDGWAEIAVTGRPWNWNLGTTDQRSDVQAAQLLATGLFIDMDAAELPEEKVRQISAAVSEAGNITAAALLTTTGTLGQVVRLSDGEDKGAVLMWSTPEGATSPTWCWWLWPQASYF